MSEKRVVLSLFHQMMREARKIENYNFRKYTLRRVRDGFRSNKDEQNVEAVGKLITEARSSLELIKRQALLSHLYRDRGNIMENHAKN